MRKTLLAIACGSALFISGAALAGDNDTGTAKLTNVSTANSDPVICKASFHEGMLIRTNNCHTRSEWENIRAHNAQDIVIMQNRAQFADH